MIFLIAGMLIGPQALGLIKIKAGSALNQIILLFGANAPLDWCAGNARARPFA